MKQAQVTEFGKAPHIVDVEAPPVPGPDSDLVQVKVLAAGLPQIVKSRAAGKHYSAKGLPHIPGVDGVGKTADGKIVYFSTMTPTGGSFQEIINVPKATVIEVPEGADPVQIAGLANPGMSSWLAVKYRTANLPKDFKVVILGATTTSGGLAVDLQRQLGAKEVIGVARNVAKLKTLGLDDYIELKEPADQTDFTKALDADLILDYLWGPPMLHLLNSWPAFKKEVQIVQIGSMAGLDMEFPAALLRSKNIVMRGSGPGSFLLPEMGQGMKTLIQQGLAKAKPFPLKQVSLAEIETRFNEPGDRIVVVP